MKRACFVCLYLFLAANLLAQSDSGFPVNPPSGLLRPIPDFRRLVPSVGEGRKVHVGDSVSARDTSQSSAPNFAPIVDYNSGGEYAVSVAVADLNGDGEPDVAVADRSTGQVGVLQGKGDGTYQPVVIYNSGEESSLSVAIADVNEDGKLDLVVAGCAIVNSGNCTNGVLSVLLGNGDGTFQTAVSYGSGGQAAEAVAVADVNGDGKPDLVVANSCPNNAVCNNSNGVVSVLLGNGDGTFQTATTYDSGGQLATSVAMADLNGDGRPDIVVANYCLSGPSEQDNDLCQHGFYTMVGVLLGNGDGTFQPVSVYNSGGYYAMSVAIADLNGDGKPDLVVSNGSDFWPDFQNGAVGVLLGHGDGTFQPTVPYTFAGAGSAAAVADVNGDGRPDLVVASLDCSSCTDGESGIGVLSGNGDGTFQPPAVLDSGGYARSIAVADVNGDRRPDLLLANGGIGVLINTTPWPTATALSTSVNPSNFGQSLTITASVTSKAAGTPTGIVTFSDGSTTLGSYALSGESATLTTNSLAIAAHSITAFYSGDGNFIGSTSNILSQVVTKSATTTTLLSSMNPSLQSKSVTFTAAVSSLAGTPTGKIKFLNGTTVLAMVTLTSGSAKYATSKLPPSTNSITAIYEGDSNNSGSTSAPVTQLVIAATTTTLTPSPNPSVEGQSVVFSATVTSSIGAPPDGGTVTFELGATVLGTEPLSGGTATFSDSTLGVGTRAIKAVYAGDANFAASTSTAVNQVIRKAASTTTLASSEDPSSYGQSLTFTATVSPQFGGTPTGSVTFYNGTATLGSTSLFNGVASYTTTKLGVGTVTITAAYKGSSSFGISTSTALSQVISVAATTTTLTSSANPSNSGQSVTLTATVAGQFGGTVTGSVTFMDGTTTLKTAGVSGGMAKYTTSMLAAGTHSITATYNGSADFTPSSASLTQTVE